MIGAASYNRDYNVPPKLLFTSFHITSCTIVTLSVIVGVIKNLNYHDNVKILRLLPKI